MDKLFILILILCIPVIFYLVIPAIGAFMSRDKWKFFRERLLDISMAPILNYGDISSGSENTGRFRFFGHIEGIQGENRIWISDGKVSVAVDLEHVSVYMLPAFPFSERNHNFEYYRTTFKNVVPSVFKWKQLFSIPEGTQVFVGGHFFKEGNRGVFRSRGEDKLMVVIYDGDKSSILNRTIWCGRQRNEYWNQFTLVSLICGVVSLLFVSYFLLRFSDLRLEAIFSLSLSLLPMAIFLPPGILLIYFYRKLWQKARYLRADRDLLMLPLRFFNTHNYWVKKDDREIVILSDNVKYILNKASLEDNRRLVKKLGLLEIRNPLGVSTFSLKKEDSWLFGEYVETYEGVSVKKPDDPMRELILIPGNPVKLAKQCNQRSRQFAFWSGVLLFFDIFFNFVLVFFILKEILLQ